MANFCKTSQGGINLDNVAFWDYNQNTLSVWFCFGDVILSDDSNLQDNQMSFSGTEATRLLAILNSVCIFDTTQERAK